MRDKVQILETPCKYVGACSALAAMLAETCNHTNWGDNNQSNFAMTLFTTLAIHGWLLYKRKDSTQQALCCLVIAGFFLALHIGGNNMVRAIGFNSILLASIFALAATALQKLHSPGLVLSLIHI